VVLKLAIQGEITWTYGALAHDLGMKPIRGARRRLGARRMLACSTRTPPCQSQGPA